MYGQSIAPTIYVFSMSERFGVKPNYSLKKNGVSQILIFIQTFCRMVYWHVKIFLIHSTTLFIMMLLDNIAEKYYSRILIIITKI